MVCLRAREWVAACVLVTALVFAATAGCGEDGVAEEPSPDVEQPDAGPVSRGDDASVSPMDPPSSPDAAMPPAAGCRPDACSGHGRCVDEGACACDAGWSGADCDACAGGYVSDGERCVLSDDEVPMGNRQVYLAPDGDDGGDCSETAPCRTFERGTAALSAGDALVLHDGTYRMAHNGSLAEFTPNGSPNPRSGTPPSGLDAAHPTVVRAQTPGQVHIEGAVTLGRPGRKVRFVLLHGLSFHTESGILNGDDNVVRACGFEGGFGIGSIDHSEGSMGNLVEDVWVWGTDARAMVTVYRAHHNTLRRVLIRSDGCAEDYCGWGPGNYAVGVTVYNAHDNVLENVLVVDRILGNNPYGYADFATAQHGSGQPEQPEGERLGRNQWLGCMTVNSQDAALVFEADAVEDGTTATLRDFVALATAGGVSLDGSHRPYEGNSIFDVEGVEVHANGADDSVFHIGCDVVQEGDPGCSHREVDIEASMYAPPMADRLPRNRYGTDMPLWPWPHEARIKQEMCDGVTRGFCADSATITDYLQGF